jgi:hypothetical protein
MTDYNIGQYKLCIGLESGLELTHLCLSVDVFKYLEETLGKRIMFLDGAMGTMVQRLKLQESDFRGMLEI